MELMASISSASALLVTPVLFIRWDVRMLEAWKFIQNLIRRKLAGNGKATAEFSKSHKQGIYVTGLLKFHLILGFVAIIFYLQLNLVRTRGWVRPLQPELKIALNE